MIVEVRVDRVTSTLECGPAERHSGRGWAPVLGEEVQDHLHVPDLVLGLIGVMARGVQVHAYIAAVIRGPRRPTA